MYLKLQQSTKSTWDYHKALKSTWHLHKTPKNTWNYNKVPKVPWKLTCASCRWGMSERDQTMAARRGAHLGPVVEVDQNVLNSLLLLHPSWASPTWPPTTWPPIPYMSIPLHDRPHAQHHPPNRQVDETTLSAHLTESISKDIFHMVSRLIMKIILIINTKLMWMVNTKKISMGN